jgi:polyisoprenoid-binding protein YceI
MITGLLLAALLQTQPVTYDVDLSSSYIEWTGTKFRGRGKHEGIVRLRAGTLGPCTRTTCQGTFIIDMHNVEITDIPESDAVPRRRLLEHLRSRDFFWTERYPDATFVLDETRAVAGGVTTRTTGRLTLRGVTQPLTFPARIVTHSDREVHVRAEVVIDRQRWGISYRFDPIRNEIVDDEISLVLVVVARSRPVAPAVDSRVGQPTSLPPDPETDS